LLSAQTSQPRFFEEFYGTDFRRLLAQDFIYDFANCPSTLRLANVRAVSRLKNPERVAVVCYLHGLAGSRHALTLSGSRSSVRGEIVVILNDGRILFNLDNGRLCTF
jgi:hypothetical protein